MTGVRFYDQREFSRLQLLLIFGYFTFAEGKIARALERLTFSYSVAENLAYHIQLCLRRLDPMPPSGMLDTRSQPSSDLFRSKLILCSSCVHSGLRSLATNSFLSLGVYQWRPVSNGFAQKQASNYRVGCAYLRHRSSIKD